MALKVCSALSYSTRFGSECGWAWCGGLGHSWVSLEMKRNASFAPGECAWERQCVIESPGVWRSRAGSPEMAKSALCSSYIDLANSLLTELGQAKLKSLVCGNVKQITII